MNVVGKVSNFITQGMYSVATPFHPFGGAVDIIVVKQEDGTFRSTPWYVRFGKFQGMLKGAEKLVRIEVNGVEANFHMHLDNSGEAYFVREVDPDKLDDSENLESSREDNKDNNIDDFKEKDFQEQDINEYKDERLTLSMNRLERVESDCDRIFYEFQDENSIEGSVEFSKYGSSRYDNLDIVERALESQDSGSEVVLVSIDGHMLTAPISSAERNVENVELDTPQFHLGPGEGTEEYNTSEDTWNADYLDDLDKSACKVTNDSEVMANSLKRNEVFKSCVELGELALKSRNSAQKNMGPSAEIIEANEDAHEKFPQSPLTNDKIDEGSPEMSGNDEGSLRSFTLPVSHVETETHGSTLDKDNNVADNGALSPCDSVFSTSVALPKVKDDNEIHGSSFDTDDDGNDRMTAQFDSNDLDLQKQIEVGITEKVMESSGEAHASEDESSKTEHVEHRASNEDMKLKLLTRMEISLCGHLLHDGIGLSAAEDAFEANRVSPEKFKLSAAAIIKNKHLIVRLQGKYLTWDKSAHVILGMAAFGVDLPIDLNDIIHVEHETQETNKDDSEMTSTPSRRWRLWPIPFRRVKTLEHSDSHSPSEEMYVDSESIASQPVVITTESPRKQIRRTNVLISDQIESLNLKDGQNMVNFVFSTRVLGSQKVEAHIYLWKWNTRIVISDVDGTITKSDVLGQFMPLVGKDWTHSGIARLFSAIKENGYQLLFLSARAIVQAYLTKSFLFNLKQDGKSLPNGPVVISPDGLFPSLYREVIRRAPHEFKIACLEDIKALFPSDYNPFYAGFGNRDTDELSYRKIGIPKGKIFIINPKGEVAINHRNEVKSYTSLHTLVHDMFPPTALIEQEDYNSWNYWKMPLPDIDNL